MCDLLDRFCRRGASVALFALILGGISDPALAQLKQQQDLDGPRREHRTEFLRQQQDPAPSPPAVATTSCVGGMAGVYPCSNIDLVAFMPMSAIGGGNGNDIWGWTDPLTGREYALMGRTNGAAFVDITDPENPVYLGNLPPHGSNSTWRDIKVYQDHAYIVSEASGHGMQVFDLAQLRDVVSPPVTFSETAHYDDFGSAHNVAINEDTGFAYAVGTGTCSGGPHFVDIRSPRAPVFAGCHLEPIYSHDTQCVVYTGPDADHQGREICVNSNENKFNIIDVTDHANSFLISETTYDGVRYTHQGWLTEDQRYWLLNDELDEQNEGHNTRTRIFDVKDLDDPYLLGLYDGPTSAIDHNLYTHNGYAYEANYRAGLRILDLEQVSEGVLTEAAFFDTYPSSNSASFSGAWSVYPYFESGIVVVSGIGEGLFILRPLLAPKFDLAVDSTALSVCDPGDATLTATLIDRNDYVGDVTLSTVDLPGAAFDSYTNNPVTVPGTSDVTVSASGLAPGSYPFTLSATDGTLTREADLTLEISSNLPGQAALVSPANAATDVSRVPTLAWNPASQAISYHVEVATDPGFGTIVFDATTSGTSAPLGTSLEAATSHYWRVRAINACGTSADSATFSFTTLTIPRILLVDDDDNSPDVQSSYRDTLDALGEDYDLWNTNNTDDEPDAESLAPYEVVIWFAGDEFGGTAGPGPGGESALETWLDSSRCLLVSSQDYYWDRGLTGLIENYLGVSTADSDVGHTTATGQGTVFSGLGPYALDFPYSNYTDDLTAGAGAEVAFLGSQGTIAVDKDAGHYRTSYWTFGLETLPTASDREAVVAAFLGWCETLAAVDGDTDGSINGEDCAPGDDTAWALPSPARDLLVDLSGVQWQPPVSPGGNSTLYDVVRSDDPSDFGSASCIEPGEADTVAADATVPPDGGLYCYLVRARNACGGTLGVDSQSTPRAAATCP